MATQFSTSLSLQSSLALVRQLGRLPAQQIRSKCIATLDSNQLPPTEELPNNSSAALRPFADIPLAGGAVPFLGHYPIMRMHQGVQRLELIRRWFKQLGPIFRVKFPCKILLIFFFNMTV